MSSENYEANVFGHDLDLLITLHCSHVSHLTRSGCREKSIRIRHVCLIEEFIYGYKVDILAVGTILLFCFQRRKPTI